MVATKDITLGDAARKVKDGVMELKSAAYEKSAQALEDYAASTDRFVHDKPYHSALIAFAFGAICGTCLGMVLAGRKNCE